MAIVIPLRTHTIDTRDGNSYQILTVQHVSGAASDVLVDDSAVSCAELPNDITASAGLAKETSTSAGTPIRNQTSGATGLGFSMATNDGVKQVTIASGVASGTYILVVRHVGNAAGVAGTKSTGL